MLTPHLTELTIIVGAIR